MPTIRMSVRGACDVLGPFLQKTYLPRRPIYLGIQAEPWFISTGQSTLKVQESSREAPELGFTSSGY